MGKGDADATQREWSQPSTTIINKEGAVLHCSLFIYHLVIDGLAGPFYWRRSPTRSLNYQISFDFDSIDSFNPIVLFYSFRSADSISEQQVRDDQTDQERSHDRIKIGSM